MPSINGVVAPAGTDAAAVDKLNAAINGLLRDSAVQGDIAKLGGQIDIGSAEDFARFIAREARRWREVADAGNIKVD